MGEIPTHLATLACGADEESFQASYIKYEKREENERKDQCLSIEIFIVAQVGNEKKHIGPYIAQD